MAKGATERFSIREYTAKMRSTDFDKCWPFDGCDQSDGSLPPVEVRKFRLWSDELQPTHEAPPEAEEREDVTLAQMQARAPATAKQRTPKKRSIAELFAVAPQVEGGAGGGDSHEEELGDSEAGEDDSERVGDSDDADRARRRKRVKDEGRGKAKRNNSKRVVSRKKKFKKKKKLKVEILAGKKVFLPFEEKARKPKTSSLVKISHILQDLVHKKLFGRAPRKHLDIPRKNTSEEKNLQKKCKGRLNRTSKMISRNQEVVENILPVQGLLKKRRNRNASKKASKTITSHNHNLIQFCCESSRHAGFSGKDPLLGHNAACLPMGLSQLQSLCKIVSHVLAASSTVDSSRGDDKVADVAKGAQTVNIGGKDIATGVTEGAGGTLCKNKVLSCIYNETIPAALTSPSNTHCLNIEKTFIAPTLDLNASQDGSDLICLNAGTSTLSPTINNAGELKAIENINNGNLNSGAEIHAEDSYTRISDTRRLLAPTGKCVLRSDTASSLTITSIPRSQISVPCVVRSMEGGRIEMEPPVDRCMHLFSHVPEFQPKYRFSPKDLISMCSSVGSKRSDESILTSDLGSTSKDKYISDDFIGLPLNSQGELIKLHSGTKFGFSEMHKKRNTVHGPTDGFSVPSYVDPRSSKDHLIMSSDNFQMKTNISVAAMNEEDRSCWFPEQFYSSSKLFDFSNLQEPERIKVLNHNYGRDKNRFTNIDQNPLKNYCPGCEKHSESHTCFDRIHLQAVGNLNHEFQPAIQPTVRLMGTNVTVGSSSKECHGYDHGKARAGKEIINCSPVRMTVRPLPKQWPPQEVVAPPASGTPEGNRFQPLHAQSNFYDVSPISARPDRMYFDCQPQWVSRNGVASTIGNHSSNVDLVRQPVPSQAVLNDTSKTLLNNFSGTESIQMTNHIPMVLSHPQNVCQHMPLSSTHCKHTPSVSKNGLSNLHPPFPNHGYQGFSNPSLSPTTQNLPLWLLNAKQQKINQQSYPPYSGPITAHHSCRRFGSDHFPLPSAYPRSMIPSTGYNGDASIVCGLSHSPAPMAHPSFVPPFAANNLDSTICSTSMSKKINGEKTKLTYLKGMDDGGRLRKRPAAEDDIFMQPAKRPYLKAHEDLNASAGPRRRNQFHGYTQQSIATTEAQANGKRIIDTSIPVLVNEQDELMGAAGSCSSKYNGSSKSRPVKLSAGAKHILKPSLSMDRDCLRPIHSTIPFSTGSNSDKILASPKKATKIYRF